MSNESDKAFQRAIAAGRLTCGCGCLGTKTDRSDPLDAGHWMYMGSDCTSDPSDKFKHVSTRRYLHQYEHDAAAKGVWVRDEIQDDLRGLMEAQARAQE